MNNDLISRSALLGGYDVRKVTEYDESGCGLEYKAVSVEAIEAAQTVDAVEVVRCWDCKYGAGRFLNGDGDVENVWCDHWSAIMPVHGFCHCGTKMDAEVEG